MPIIQPIRAERALGGAPQPSVQVDTSVGRAVEGLGNALGNAAAAEQEMQLRRAKMDMQVREFRADQDFRQFNESLGSTITDAQAKMDPSGQGLTDHFVEKFDEKSKEFLASVPEGLRPKFQELVQTSRAGWVDKVSGQEVQQRYSWYRDGIQKAQDGLETQVFNDPSVYDAARADGRRAILSSGLPEAEKKNLVEKWDNTLAVRVAQRGIESDPAQVANGLGIAHAPLDSDQKSNYLDIAKSFIGANEGTDGKALSEFIKRSCGISIDPKQTAWCAAYVNGVLGAAGIDGTGSLAAKSFLKFGEATDSPKVGDIVVLNRGDPNGPSGHVGFYAGKDANGNIKILGGNQSNGVSVQSFPADRVAGFRRPPNVANSEDAAAALKALPGGAPSKGMVVGQPDPRLASLTLDQRLKLMDSADARMKANESAAKAQQTALQQSAYDTLSLGIVTGDIQSEQTILGNPNVDDGQKATLIRSLRTQQNENADVSTFVDALSSGQGAPVNSFDSSQTTVADKAYSQILKAVPDENKQSVANAFVSQTGYIPKQEVASLRQGVASANPHEVASALVKADSYEEAAPEQFRNGSGMSDASKALDLFRTYTQEMGYTDVQAAQKVIDARDPEKVKARDALLKSDAVKAELKRVDADRIASSFDESIAGLAFNPTLGQNAAAEAAMVSDYRDLYQESIVDTNGDIEAAKSLADKKFHRIYGVSEMTTFGDGVVIKYPPEKLYPADPSGSHDWIMKQAQEALKLEGVDTLRLWLQPDDMTEKDFNAGRPPRYQVYYDNNGTVERFNLPFYADVNAMRQDYLSEAKARNEQDRQLQLERQGRASRADAAAKKAYEETRGDDFTKMRAADRARLTVLSERTPVEQKQDQNSALHEFFRVRSKEEFKKAMTIDAGISGLKRNRN